MRFDINKIKRLILLALPAVAMSSCINEDFDGMDSNSQEGKEKMYVTIHVKSPDGLGTRAIPEDSNYENGEEGTEHPTGDKIRGAHAIFFDASGNFMEMTDMNPMNYKNWNAEPSEKDKEEGLVGAPGHHGEGDYDGDSGIEATYFTVLTASLNKAEQPKKVLVVLNDEPIYSQLEAKAFKGSTISDFTSIIWQNRQGGTNKLSQTFAGASSYFDEDFEEETGFFTLSNAAYLDNKGVAHYAYDIPENAFKPTQKAAKEARDEECVIVHVERMVSKFTPVFFGYTSDKLTYRPYDGNQVTIAKFDDNGEPTYEAQNWNMTITGWAMNGLETQNYLFKKISNTSYYGWSSGNANGWNDTKEYRSYWGEDPHYGMNQGLYPFQYRRAVEKNLDNDFKYYGDQAHHGTFESRGENDKYDWALKYFSYNELNGNGIRQNAYAPENTFSEEIATDASLDKRNNKIAGTHMLFCADLRVTTDGMNNFEEVGEHFYKDRIGICYYTEADLFWGFVRAVNRKLESQEYMRYTFYTWDDSKGPITPHDRYFLGTGHMKLYYGDQPLTYELVKQLVANNNLTIPAPILHGDGKVMVWPVAKTDADKGMNTWLYNNKLNIRTEDGKVVTDTYLRGSFDPISMTYDYTTVPGGLTAEDIMSLFYEWCGAVDHYHWGKMYYAAPILHRKSSETGSQDIYGNVRNHWYKLNITSVLKLGTPVDDLDQRIIPDDIKNNDALKIDVEILPWHVLDFYVNLPN